MEIQMIGAGCAAISVHTSIEGPGTAAELVRAALRLSGLEPWKRMELETTRDGEKRADEQSRESGGEEDTSTHGS